MSFQHSVKRQGKGQGKGQRLNDRQRMEIIALLDQPEPQSMRSIARQFEVDEKTIRKVKSSKNVIRKRAQNAKQATQETIFRQAMFPELENRLAKFIDDFYGPPPIGVPPIAICFIAKSLATIMGIPNDKFKASLNWLDRFLHRHDLKFNDLFGYGGEVDRNNLKVALIESNDECDGSSSDNLESNDESDESLSDNQSTEVNEKFQLDAIMKSSQNVKNLEVSMSKLQSSPFLSSDQINQANSALITLKRILVAEPSQFTNPYYP